MTSYASFNFKNENENKGTFGLSMNREQEKKVHDDFQNGSRNFTQDDLEIVMDKEETARKKASYLGKQLENFKLLWSLLKDYWNGNYKAPWKLIASVGFAVAYLISPFDVIPDFIPCVGYLDDASVFALVMASFQSDVDEYKRWLLTKGKTE